MSNIVPFGKYRNQPVEVMLSDHDYCEWLVSQDWFKQRFQPIYNVLIQGVPDPQDSPEHNALQARFLDEKFQTVFLNLIGLSHTFPVNVDFETGQAQIDVGLRMSGGCFDIITGKNLNLWEDEAEAKGLIKYAHYDFDPGFHVAVEVKPTIGDDFPTVLRQVKSKIQTLNNPKSRDSNMFSFERTWYNERVRLGAVAYNKFTATTVTVEQVAAMFAPIKLACVGDL